MTIGHSLLKPTVPRAFLQSIEAKTERCCSSPEKAPLLQTFALLGSLPLRTNTSTTFTLDFEDRDSAKFPRRFYRARFH
jgi:hypothetical protein